MAKALFLSYDGMTDQLGGSQVLPYLVGLAARGHRIDLVSFEKPDATAEARAIVARLCAEAGIEWHPQVYHRTPPVLSTVRDVWRMRRVARRLNRTRRFDLVHCRSYVPALVGLWLKRTAGVRFMFDMRGFWPDEKREGNFWPEGHPLFDRVYRYFKRREVELLRDADTIVSLTETGRTTLAKQWDVAQGRVGVIPCCVDFEHFDHIDHGNGGTRAVGRAALGIDAERPVFLYLGSLGGLYMLPQMMRAFSVYRDRRPGALFLVVTRDDPALVVREAAKLGISEDELLIRPATRADVPKFVAAADHSVSFIRPSFSKKASSPTKLGELLAMGIPVLTNSGVGDVAEVMRDVGGGVAIDDFEDATIAKAVDAMLALEIDAAALRVGAKRHFDLADGIDSYDRLYHSLA